MQKQETESYLNKKTRLEGETVNNRVEIRIFFDFTNTNEESKIINLFDNTYTEFTFLQRNLCFISIKKINSSQINGILKYFKEKSCSVAVNLDEDPIINLPLALKKRESSSKISFN